MENEKPNYYAIIPANVRYDEDLRANAKLLYGEITALTYKTGICYASNNYFARLYQVDASAISKWIKNLQDKEYITVNYVKENNQIVKREIKINGIAINQYLLPKDNEGYCQKNKENNTSINNINNKEKNIKKKVFKKPTLEEVENYVIERNSTVDARKFFDYYDVADWDGVKNWKQKLITWESHQPKKKVDIDDIDLEKLQREIDEEERQNEIRRNKTTS